MYRQPGRKQTATRSARKYEDPGTPESPIPNRATKAARKYADRPGHGKLALQRQSLGMSPRRLPLEPSISRAPRMSAAPLVRKSVPKPVASRPVTWLNENLQLMSSISDSDDDGSSDGTGPPVHRSKARKLVLSDEESDPTSDEESKSEPVPPESESEEEEDFQAPSEDIVMGLQLLAGPLRRLERDRRLPFLKWNLQRGFELFCRSAGVNLEEEGEMPNAMLIYRQIGGDRWETALGNWCCPLCNLHGIFRYRILLEKHIEFDHKDVHVRWLKRQTDDGPTWIIRVTIPKKESEEEPPPIPFPEKREREATPGLPPSPPREKDPLGPAACMPYFPAKSQYGGPNMKYSCRPGGGRIYDLIGTLPMEPYGVLGWLVLDKEDEIFDNDDLKDEHKVMHALWARWIMLNRNLFVQNFYSGTCKFVDEYWQMIHWAAGWRALRYWLLLLLSNGFLSGLEVAKVLEHYSDLVKGDVDS